MEDPEQMMTRLRAMPDGTLHDVAEAVRQIQLERAISAGDLDALVGNGFEVGFGRDGLGVSPWIEGNNLVVCPGAIVTTSRTNHRCRFVSVDDVWVWDSALLVREDKRSTPGGDGRANAGFRAIALVALVDGTTLDVVSGRARSGGHEVEHVESIEVRGGQLIVVSQRKVAAANMR